MSEREFAAFFSSAKMAGVAPRQYALARSAGYCIPLAWRRHRAKACQTMADPLNCFPCHPAHYSKLHDVLSRLGYAEVPEHLAEQLPPVPDGAAAPQAPARPRRRGLLLQVRRMRQGLGTATSCGAHVQRQVKQGVSEGRRWAAGGITHGARPLPALHTESLPESLGCPACLSHGGHAEAHVLHLLLRRTSAQTTCSSRI